MNTRKFYLILCSVVSLFLFTVGIMALLYINSPAGDDDTSVFSNILDSFKAEKKPVNILLMVTDNDEYRTDTMMLVNFNPATAQISIMSIPRDTKVNLKGAASQKINFAYAAGGEGAKGAKFACDTVGKLLGVNIRYYAILNIKAFREIIDSLGGVEFNVPVKIDYEDPSQDLYIHLEKGKQHLGGKQAEQLLRFRKLPDGQKYSKELLQYYDGSDTKRTEMQISFIKELIRQKANIKYITKMNEILDVVFKYTKTNISLNDALKLSHNLNKLSQNELKAFRLSGQDKYIDGVSYFLYDGNIYDVSAKDTVDAKEITKAYFTSEAGFSDYVNKGSSGTDNSDSGDKSSNGSKGDSSTGKDTSGSKNNSGSTGSGKDYTEDNPSNSETSIEGSESPEP